MSAKKALELNPVKAFAFRRATDDDVRLCVNPTGDPNDGHHCLSLTPEEARQLLEQLAEATR